MQNMSQLRRNDHTPTRQSQDHVSLGSTFLEILPKPLARILTRCEHHVYWINPFAAEINSPKPKVLARDESSYLLAHNDPLEIMRPKQFKDDDGHLIIHAKGKGG